MLPPFLMVLLLLHATQQLLKMLLLLLPMLLPVVLFCCRCYCCCCFCHSSSNLVPESATCCRYSYLLLLLYILLLHLLPLRLFQPCPGIRPLPAGHAAPAPLPPLGECAVHRAWLQPGAPGLSLLRVALALTPPARRERVRARAVATTEAGVLIDAATGRI